MLSVWLCASGQKNNTSNTTIYKAS